MEKRNLCIQIIQWKIELLIEEHLCYSQLKISFFVFGFSTCLHLKPFRYLLFLLIFSIGIVFDIGFSL